MPTHMTQHMPHSFPFIFIAVCSHITIYPCMVPQFWILDPLQRIKVIVQYSSRAHSLLQPLSFWCRCPSGIPTCWGQQIIIYFSTPGITKCCPYLCSPRSRNPVSIKLDLLPKCYINCHYCSIQCCCGICGSPMWFITPSFLCPSAFSKP